MKHVMGQLIPLVNGYPSTTRTIYCHTLFPTFQMHPAQGTLSLLTLLVSELLKGAISSINISLGPLKPEESHFKQSFF